MSPHGIIVHRRPTPIGLLVVNPPLEKETENAEAEVAANIRHQQTLMTCPIQSTVLPLPWTPYTSRNRL